MSDFSTVVQYVLDAYKVPSVASERTRLQRSLCEVLKSLRSEQAPFNGAEFTFDTVADQQTYARDNAEESSSSKLPSDFWGVRGRRLFNTTYPTHRTIEPFGVRGQRQLHNTRSVTGTGAPRYWTSEYRKIDLWPIPGGAYTISGSYQRDLGAPAPRYMDSNITYEASAAFQFDDSTKAFEDVLADLLNPGTTAQPFPAGAGANDAFYVLFDEVPSSPIAIVVDTAGAGTYTLDWQYYNGFAWTSFSGVTDGTNGLKNTGSNTLAFTDPSNWSPKVVNGSNRAYGIRAVRDGGTVTTDPLLNIFASTGNDAWEFYLLEEGGAERIAVDSYANAWFDEALQVLVHGTAHQYHLIYRRDAEMAQQALQRYQDAMSVLNASNGTWVAPPRVRPSLGWRRRGAL